MSKKLSRAERKQMRARSSRQSPPIAAKNTAQTAPNSVDPSTDAQHVVTPNKSKDPPKQATNKKSAGALKPVTKDVVPDVVTTKPAKKKPHPLLAFGVLIAAAALVAYFIGRWRMPK